MGLTVSKVSYRDKTYLKRFLEGIKSLNCTFRFWDQETLKVGSLPPEFTVEIKKPIPMAALFKSPTLALGEAYMRGDIEVEGDLFAALSQFMAALGQFKTRYRLLPRLYQMGVGVSRQKAEVQSHYDIGNEFYRLWLDESLSYSCAYFTEQDQALSQAQRNKILYTLSKLDLAPGMTLLDIGCGWGQLLACAAREYGVRGLGITLSREQLAECQAMARREGLDKQLEFRLMDYRQLKESGLKFDRIVSVGMLEHVGRKNYSLYFENVDRVLKPGGLLLLHFISGRREYPGDAWIKKYIFPGGMLPSLREILHIAGDKDYPLLDAESLRPHYALTLLAWRENFESHLTEIRAMFDERFVRMWRLYLTACAASFRAGAIDLHQLLFSKGPAPAQPLTRSRMRV